MFQKGGINPAKTHGMSGTRTHLIWKAMLYRARHKPTKAYAHVTLCKRWLKFENFFKDMGKCPSSSHSIDRIKNRQGYKPSNCRWANRQQQAENRNMTDWLVFKGEKRTLTEWARIHKMPRLALHQRLYKLNWTVEKALTTPVRVFHKSEP